MKKKIKNIFYGCLPKEIAHKIVYKKKLGKKLNLKNPKDFNEKIQYMIIHEYGKKYADLTDKIKVREYVENKCGNEILTKLYGIYNNAKEIDINNLPNEFVLKTNHFSGKVFICTDKEKFNFEECKRGLNKQLKSDYSKEGLEYHYSYIKPQIMCEEYLKEEGRKNPLDYKIYCFNGKPNCIMVCSERENKTRYDYYDLEWNYLDYAKPQWKSSKKVEKPTNLKEMLDIAEKLSKEFKFVRVDLYSINNKIYFGELTFTPAGGLYDKVTDKTLEYFGNLIKL